MDEREKEEREKLIAWLDVFVDQLGDELKETRTYIPDPRKYNYALRSTQKIIDYFITIDPYARMTVCMGEVLTDTINVHVFLHELIVPGTKEFALICALPDSIDIYPDENGDIELVFSFDRVLVRIA